MSVSLDDPSRLRALARSGLMDSGPEEAFDRLTRLAARLLGARVALVSLVDGERHYIKSAVGLDLRQTALSRSFCERVVVERAALIVSDARLDPRVPENLAVAELGGVAYASVPLTVTDGHTLGSLCVIERSLREWSEDDVALLGEVAHGVISEINLRVANRKLQVAEERFRRTFEHAPIGVALVDPDGRWLQVNRALCEIVGYSEAELLKLTYRDITHPDDCARDIENVRQMLAGAIPRYQTEKRYLHRDGRVVWIKLHSSLVREVTGEPLHFVSQIEDVTVAKRADEALRQAELRLRAIFDNIPAGLALRALDGRYIQVNNYIARALQTTTEELSGHNPAEHLDAEAIARLRANDAEMVRSCKPVVQETSVRDPDGTNHDYHVVSYPVVDEHGTVVALGAFTLDITERKRIERAVKRALEELDEAQRIAGIGSWSWNTNADVAAWSPEMYRIFARDRADGPATNEQFFAYAHPADRERLAAGYEQTFGGGASFELDYRIVAGDGTHRTLHALGRRDPSSPGHYRGTVQDVTELRHTELEVRRERDYMAMITSSMREGLLLTHEETIIDVNDALCEITGFSREELIGAPVPFPFWASGSVEQIKRHRRETRAGPSREIETEYIHKDGARFHVSVNTVVAHPAGSEFLGYVSTIRDITDQLRQRAQLERFATRDSLTGFVNRRVFHEELGMEIARAERHGRPLSLALLDLDDFKEINDRYGHPTGDTVLREAAQRIGEVVREGEHIARVGGEEFAWILPDATSAGAYAAAERAREAILASPFAGVGAVTLSAGVCQFADAGDAERLYQLADEALYHAKEQGRNQTCRHDDDSGDATDASFISR